MPMNGQFDCAEDSSVQHFGGSSAGTPHSPESVYDKYDSYRPETVLEGWMLKRNRNNHWQDRYFVFQSNQILSYWHKSSTSKKEKEKNNSKNNEIDATHVSKDPTATFKVSRQAGCEIGDIYVEQKSVSSLPASMASASSSGGKLSLYCIDITWTEDTEMVINQPEKIHSRNYSDEVWSPHHVEDDNQNQTWDQASVNSTNSARRKKTSFLRRRKLRKRKSDPEVLYDASKVFEQYSPNFDSSLRESTGSGGAPISDLEIDRKWNNANETYDPYTLKVSKSEEFEAGDTLRRQNSCDDRERLEQEKLHNDFVNKRRKKRSVKAKRMVGATKVAMAAGAAVGVGVVTAGVGLAAGMLVLGGAAAIGGTAGVAEAGLKRNLKKKDNLTIATTDYTTARLWKNKLDTCLEQEYINNSTWAQRFAADGGKTASTLIPRDVISLKTTSTDEHDNSKGAGNDHLNRSTSKSNVFLRDANFLEQGRAKWMPLDGGWGSGSQSLRIFKEEKIGDDERSMKVSRSVTDDESTCTPLKTQLVLNAHHAEAFMCIMSYARLSSSPIYNHDSMQFSPNSGQCASHRLIEKIDDHMDVLHLVCRPLYLSPVWTKPRDYVLNRYWRCEPDGSFIICYESTERADCPHQPGFVRGTMHQVYTIAPPKSYMNRRKGPMTSECMLTAVVQVNPQGWVPTRQILCQRSKETYADSFGVAALLQTLDIRDAIETDRFEDKLPDLHPYQQQLNVDKTAGVMRGRDSGDLDPRFVSRERCDTFTSENFPSIGNIPAPLGPERWAEPDPDSFLVRGPNYLEDGKKINAGSSIGQLIAMDCVLVDKPIFTGMSVHPRERIQLALKREKEMMEKGQICDTPAFIFVVNIVVPAAQCFHAVFYYAVHDMSTIDGSDGTPSSRLCQKFFFGDSDTFRDETFKLIPRIVEGNFLVRKAVGSTPAIMGTRLKQYYVRTDRFMEIVLDCGSSQVAEGVIKLSLGYAKTLVVDMGFLLEAVEEEHLPERILGCVRVKYPSFGNELRRVEEQPLHN